MFNKLGARSFILGNVITIYLIAPNKVLFSFVNIFFLFLHKNICCGYSLEALQ